MFLELAQAASAYWAPALFVLQFSLNKLEPAVKPTHLCRESGPCVSTFGTDAPEICVLPVDGSVGAPAFSSFDFPPERHLQLLLGP